MEIRQKFIFRLKRDSLESEMVPHWSIIPSRWSLYHVKLVLHLQKCEGHKKQALLQTKHCHDTFLLTVTLESQLPVATSKVTREPRNFYTLDTHRCKGQIEIFIARHGSWTTLERLSLCGLIVTKLFPYRTLRVTLKSLGNCIRPPSSRFVTSLHHPNIGGYSFSLLYFKFHWMLKKILRYSASCASEQSAKIVIFTYTTISSFCPYTLVHLRIRC